MDNLLSLESTSVAHGDPVPQSPQPPKSEAVLRVDDSEAGAFYANFCRLLGSPEELILDFGLNARAGNETHTFAVTQRIIMSWQIAKSLQQVLQLTIDRHEAAFGHLETDIQKRASGPLSA